ncbi:hypothetical protein [Sphingomonas sp.]|uniref:hypothetical protein n=1 Tax=Sphingomonas sp. TaxID=28214 RepID=UPI002CC6EF72|nr:hypothetical protein [Sphingomonas sp.]HWK35002.1 hypothetical protein [Sphingomonas sp.]
MRYLTRFSPFRAIQDLRVFLSARRPHELGFLALAIVMTTLLIAGFIHDSHEERVYKREITYFQSWPLTRSDEEIRAQQAIDLPKELALKAELERRQKERQAQFKKYDDQLTKWGF